MHGLEDRGRQNTKAQQQKLIWEYIDFTESGGTTQFKFRPVDSLGNIIDRHKMIYNVFCFIQKETRYICQSMPNRYDFPDLVTATQEENFF